MRKMKKINGFLVVRFNDREKRVYPELGSFGIIDAEQYVGDIDYDLGEMEYTDAETIEIAVEQARGLNAEEDFTDESTTYTVITETAAESQETTVAPKAFVMSYENRLKTQVKSDHYDDGRRLPDERLLRRGEDHRPGRAELRRLRRLHRRREQLHRRDHRPRDGRV